MAGTDGEALTRLGGGRWRTKDERFTIEPQGGTWSLVDAEQTDELGLPLVRGPYRSLTAAKEAIAHARGGHAPASPLTDRSAEIQRRATDASAPPRRPRRRPRSDRSGPASVTADSGPDQTLDDAAQPEEIPEGLRVERIFVIEATYASDAAARRPAVRDEHLRRSAELMADGRLIEGGGYLDLSTAILFVRADSEAEAMAMFEDDVYARSGVWRGKLRVKAFGRVVLAGPQAEDAPD